MQKTFMFLVGLASFNWWFFLISWTWFGRRPEGDVITANAVTSLCVFAIGWIGWLVVIEMRNNKKV